MFCIDTINSDMNNEDSLSHKFSTASLDLG